MSDLHNLVLLATLTGLLALSSSRGSHNNHGAIAAPLKQGNHSEALMGRLKQGCQGPTYCFDHNPKQTMPASIESVSTSSLIWSKEFVDLAAVEKLVSTGIDINKRDNRGATALLYAVAHATRPVVEKLLKSGADVNLPDRFRDTPLLVAISARRKDIMDMLIKRGADVNAHNRYGESAISKANCDDAMVTALLKNGAKVDAYALSYSAYMHDVKPAIIGKLLDSGVSVDIRDDQGRTALMCAAYSDNVPLILELIRRGANVKVRDHYGMSVLDYASCATRPKNRRVVAVLKRAGAR